MSVLIHSVIKNSLCDRKGICAGDTLIYVNGHEITDVLDYDFYIDSAKDPVISVKSGGRYRIIKLKRAENEDIGLQFETYLMDKQHSCKNKCIFCFIDQLPKGLRESLYFKDDDSRMSFLFGNYITLTNLTDREAKRIVEMHISPVNISVHTTNPELRVKMMVNPHAGESLKYLYYFAENGVKINTQLVLCPGINDGDELVKSLEDLGKLYPCVESIAAVPVGLTKHRENLPKIEPYTKESAAQVIDIIDSFNDGFRKKYGVTVAYAADEFYLKAELPIPDNSYYNDYPQLENGIGLCRLLKEEFILALKENEQREIKPRKISIATGSAAFGLISELAQLAQKCVNGLKINVYEVKNKLFGESVTVGGLICGNDFFKALNEKELGDELLIPAVSLRREGDIFLDDMSLDELSSKLGVKVTPVINDGFELLRSMIG